MAANPENEAQNRQMAEAVNSQSSNWMKRGTALLNEGKAGPAAQAFTSALGLDPKNPALHNNLAIALELDGLVDVRTGSGVYVMNKKPPSGKAGPWACRVCRS